MNSTVPDEDFRIDIDVRSAERLLLVGVSGMLSLAGLASLGPAARKGRELTADWGVIYDFSNASAEKIFRADLEGLAAELSSPSPERTYRVAYVVPSDLSFGLARMYAVLADYAAADAARPRFVTRTLAEALEWMQGRFAD